VIENNHDEPSLGRWVEERLERLAPDMSWQPDVQRGLAQLRLNQAPARHARRWLRVTAGTAAACLSLMAMPATRAFARRCVSACVSESGLLHSLLVMVRQPAASVVYVPPNRRKMAPDFVLAGATGAPVRLSDFRGKVVLLNFWATWCVPCRTEIPWFVEFQRSYAADFEVLGVSLDDGGWNSVKPYIEQRNVNYPVMLANDEVTRAYGGMQALPMTLIVDKSGRIAAVHIGLCSRSEFENDIQTALHE